MPLIHNAPLKEWWHRCYASPIPGPGERHPTAHPYSPPVATLSLECSALLVGHEGQSLSAWFTCAAKQVGSWLYLETWEHSIHHALEVMVYGTRTGIHLITLLEKRELCPSQYNFNWYLRHLELLRILVQKKKSGLNSLWYSCLIFIYLFLTSIHNLLSASLWRFKKYCWNNQLLHSHQKNFSEASETKGTEKKARKNDRRN